MREIWLENYLPPVTAEMEEFKRIVIAENPEFVFLFSKMEQLLDDNFFMYASVSAIRRYESMLGIRPSPKATLEDRRKEIQIRWNRRLPYTYLRLREMLAEWVGNDFFEIDTSRFKEYEIEIILKEQKLIFLQFLRKELREIIPANMIFDLTGRYLEHVKTKIAYESVLTLRSDFYPRGNKGFLCLDGSWILDGTYYLGGWRAEEGDYYSSRLSLQGEHKIYTQIDNTLTIEKDLWCLDGTYMLDGEKMLDAEVIVCSM